MFVARLLYWTKRAAVFLLGIILLGLLAAYIAGSYLTSANHSHIGELPNDLVGESVLIPSPSGSSLHGWFIPGGRGAVVLLHSLHGTRETMLTRARMLNQAGYTVLLFDFQANGESPGKNVTFGYLESLDARAAVDYMHRRLPGQKVGAVGVSMGGAAAILARPPLSVDALVLEEVYPDVKRAVTDRLEIRFGPLGSLLGPLLTLQLRYRLGFSPNDLRPIDRVSELHVPKLFIAGSADEHTRIEESRELFAAACEPKELWIVSGARHVDLYAYAPSEYKEKVLGFLNSHLH